MLTTKLYADFDGRYEPMMFERLKAVLSQSPYQPCYVNPFFRRTTNTGSTECSEAGGEEEYRHDVYIETWFYSCGLDVKLRYWGAKYFSPLVHEGTVLRAEIVDPEKAQIEVTLQWRFSHCGTDSDSVVTDLLTLFDLLHPIGVRRVRLELQLTLAYDVFCPVVVEKWFRLPPRPKEGFVASREVAQQLRTYLGYDGPLQKALSPQVRRDIRYFRQTFKGFCEEWDIYFPNKSFRKFLGLR